MSEITLKQILLIEDLEALILKVMKNTNLRILNLQEILTGKRSMGLHQTMKITSCIDTATETKRYILLTRQWAGIRKHTRN